MIHSASLPNLAPELDGFLLAPVGDDKNGMLLSVLSALARLDVDPWQEATDLSQLPRSTAIERMTSLIAALPAGPTLHHEPGTIAARLIALLPGHTASTVPSRGGLTGSGSVTNMHAVLRIVTINLIFVGLMLGAQWMATSHLSSTQVAETPATTSRTNSAQLLTPSPGQ
jgi:hypothetical protein